MHTDEDDDSHCAALHGVDPFGDTVLALTIGSTCNVSEH